uniref:Uncharacterized protein n=1 Tax=Gallus gallus TaxID=9031 RepID=A0A8V0ZDS1_CHICK
KNCRGLQIENEKHLYCTCPLWTQEAGGCRRVTIAGADSPLLPLCRLSVPQWQFPSWHSGSLQCRRMYGQTACCQMHHKPSLHRTGEAVCSLVVRGFDVSYRDLFIGFSIPPHGAPLQD